MTVTERRARPGEVCSCGTRAVIVYVSEDRETPWCGSYEATQDDDEQEPAEVEQDDDMSHALAAARILAAAESVAEIARTFLGVPDVSPREREHLAEADAAVHHALDALT